MTVPVTVQVRDAVGSLLATYRRSLLALVGIVVGIGSVIALMTIGSIVRSEAMKQFQALGTDMLSVFDVTPDNVPGVASRALLDTGKASQLPKLPAIVAASPYTYHPGNLRLGGAEVLSVRRVGVTSVFEGMHRLELTDGRFVSSFDGRRPFAVIGGGVANAMRASGAAPEVGSSLRVDEDVYTLIGILKWGSKGPPGMRMDESVLIPIERAQREIGTKEVLGVTLRKAAEVHYLDAAAEVEAHFKRTAPGMKVRVDSPVWIIEQMENQMRLFALLLGTVGGISLVVGGFGVMNAMLAAVNERRLEIGIRRALGARRSDIQGQFLAESSVMCLVGGLLGAVLGVGATLVISLLADWTWRFSAGSVALGIGTACAVGLFFGYYPARQAARLEPIATLRDG